MRSRAQLREIDISSYLKVKKSAFSIAQRRRGFREVVTQAASAHAKNGRRGSPRHHVPSLSPLPSREERLYLPSITSSYRRRYVKVGRFGATGANNRRCLASLNFRKTPKGLPTFSSRSTYQDTGIDGVTRVLAGLGTGRIHRCAVCNRGSCNAITCWIPDHRRIVTAPRLGGSDTRSFSPSVFLSLTVPFFLSIPLYFLLLSLSLCFSFSPSVSFSYSVSDFVRSESTPYPLEMYSERCGFGLQTFRAKWKRNNIMVIGALSQRGKLAASVS